MSERSKEKQASEQTKAQDLFSKWRKDETLYEEDKEDDSNKES